MTTVACIPVHGRIELVKQTIRRLYKKNGVAKVICAGSTKAEKDACESEGAEFFMHPNDPLGKKWNAIFMRAKHYNPDDIVFVGSSDWLSDNWIDVMRPYLKDYEMVGVPGFHLLDISKSNVYRLCFWSGYVGERADESIGIGRLISRRALEKMDWKPFVDDRNNGMDYSMQQNVLKNGGNVKMLKTDEITCLSLSTNRWPNKHQFEDHWNNKLPSEKILDHSMLKDKFPEAYHIFSK
jgi:hypothetical protein